MQNASGTSARRRSSTERISRSRAPATASSNVIASSRLLPRRAPVALAPQPPVGLDVQQRAGRQLLQALEERLAGLVERLVAVDEEPLEVALVDRRACGRAARTGTSARSRRAGRRGRRAAGRAASRRSGRATASAVRIARRRRRTPTCPRSASSAVPAVARDRREQHLGVRLRAERDALAPRAAGAPRRSCRARRCRPSSARRPRTAGWSAGRGR